MDHLYFLKRRTDFIRKYFDRIAPLFEETKRQIEAEKPPYVQPYSESGEPAFLNQWGEANDMLEMLGRSCISMLSGALQVYFIGWDRALGLNSSKIAKSTFSNRGWLAGYMEALATGAGIVWVKCPTDQALLEQIVLARNLDQHPETITTTHVSHNTRDLKKHPQPFFLDQLEAGLVSENGQIAWIFAPRLYVAREKLMPAIEEVERFSEWLEERLLDIRYSSRRDRQDPADDLV
jgi:hypothetical protein